MMFSATLDHDVDVLVRRFMSSPVVHTVGADAAPPPVVHHVLTIGAADRVGIVTALAGGQGRSLVFTRTKHAARKLAHQLSAAAIPAAELHGNLAQNARERNLAAFSTGSVRVLVATDIAARGIHVDGIDLVIHADPPAEDKAYVHRSGRTARAGASGVVVTLQTAAQSRDVATLMRRAGVVPLRASVRPGSALLTQIAGPAAGRTRVVRPARLLAEPVTAGASSAGTGAGAVALSARYRGRRR
jgi:superfamily II DNA/RNA helicase